MLCVDVMPSETLNDRHRVLVLVLILHEEVFECWRDSHHVPTLAPKEAGVTAPFCSGCVGQDDTANFFFDVNHDLWPPDKNV
jgi:hypothetical protein